VDDVGTTPVDETANVPLGVTETRFDIVALTGTIPVLETGTAEALN